MALLPKFANYMGYFWNFHYFLLGRCHSWQVCVWQQNPSNFIGHFSWRGPMHLFDKTSSVRPRSFYAFCSVQGWKLQNSVGSQPEIHWTSGWSTQIYGRRFVYLFVFIHYGNMGCPFSSGGIQNKIDFWTNINLLKRLGRVASFQWHYHFRKLGVSKNWSYQNVSIHLVNVDYNLAYNSHNCYM